MADRNEVQKRVVSVVSKVLKIEPSEIKPESNFIFDLGADSMASLGLVSGFETEFDIEMDEEGALEIQNVGDAVDFIMKYVK
jgi:acyl carrier protein